jgi:hypothetical protein
MHMGTFEFSLFEAVTLFRILRKLFASAQASA